MQTNEIHFKIYIGSNISINFRFEKYRKMEPSDPYNSNSFGYIIHIYLLPSTKVNANNPAIKMSRKAVALIILEWHIHKPEEGYRSRRGVRCI